MADFARIPVELDDEDRQYGHDHRRNGRYEGEGRRGQDEKRYRWNFVPCELQRAYFLSLISSWRSEGLFRGPLVGPGPEDWRGLPPLLAALRRLLSHAVLRSDDGAVRNEAQGPSAVVGPRVEAPQVGRGHLRPRRGRGRRGRGRRV